MEKTAASRSGSSGGPVRQDSKGKAVLVTAFNLLVKQASVIGHETDADESPQTEAKPEELEKVDLQLPSLPENNKRANFACMTSTASCKFPIPAFIKTDFNVNAGYGGGTALMLVTSVYDLNYLTFTNELSLIRCGFSGNHYECISLGKAGDHSLYRYIRYHTDPDGCMSPCVRYGLSKAIIVSNIPQMGHCGVMAVYSGPEAEDGSGRATFATEIPASDPGQYGRAMLVLCSAPGEESSNAYFVAVGYNPDQLVARSITNKLVDDLWKFSCSEGTLTITGPSKSHYGIWLSDSNHAKAEVAGKVTHSQTFCGSEPTVLAKSLSNYEGHCVLIMCSSSAGNDDLTTSALYMVNIQSSGIKSSFVSGSSGSANGQADAWTISQDDDQLLIVGPSKPCRYCFLSTIPEDVPDPQLRFSQSTCLATGSESTYRGAVYLDSTVITGWVSRMSQVQIMLNGSTIELVEPVKLLEQPDGRLGFKRQLSSEEHGLGLKLLQVFGLTTDIDNRPVRVELTGSPYRIINQPQGVLYAVNLGGPTYEALNQVVFSGTEATYETADEADGLQCLRKFDSLISSEDNLYNMMDNSYDGYLYSTHIETHPGFASDMSIKIPVEKSEKLTLKLHSVGDYLKDQDITIGEDLDISAQVSEKLATIPEKVPGYTAKVVSVPFINHEGNDLQLKFHDRGESQYSI